MTQNPLSGKRVNKPQQQTRNSLNTHRAPLKPKSQFTPAAGATGPQRYGKQSPAAGTSPFQHRRGGVHRNPQTSHKHKNMHATTNAMTNSEDETAPIDDDDDADMTPQQRNQQRKHKAQQQHHAHVPLSFDNTLPYDVCTQHHVPAHATFSLTSIQSLVQYITPGSMVIFDIDDTLVKRKFNNTSLLTQHGTSMFHNYLQSPACQNMSYEEKQALVNQLGSALKSFVCAEDDTTTVVKALQQRGCYVFALTARSSTMSTTTTVSLNSLGIDFKTSLPPTMPSHSIEPNTGAAVIDGVIYCNDVPKGVVFQRLLAQQWITFPVLHQCSQYTCNNSPTCQANNTIVACTAQQTAHHKNMSCPDRTVWFIDDSLPMLSSMLTSWQQYAHQRVEFYNSLQPSIQSQMPCQGKSALVCCHYTHPTNYTLNPQANPCKINPQDTDKVIALQIHHFIKYQQLLTDLQAVEMLGSSLSQPTISQPVI